METRTLDFSKSFKTKAALSAFMGIFAKLKKLYKKGCYCINNSILLPDERSIQLLTGFYKAEFLPKIKNTLDSMGLPDFWYLEDTAVCVTKDTSLTIQIFNKEQEERLRTKLLNPYLENYKDNYFKHQKLLIDEIGMDSSLWEQEMFVDRHVLTLRDSTTFYYNLHLFPFLTPLLAKGLYYTVEDQWEEGLKKETIGIISFSYDTDIFQIYILFYYLKYWV